MLLTAYLSVEKPCA